MASSWTIGSKPDCDLVVAVPVVSGHHCRLTVDDQGCWLEDLGSTNGTFVKGVKISGRVRVAANDPVTLGPTEPMPWPALPGSGLAAVRIGRAPDNDLVIGSPIVSGYHARVIRGPRPGEAIIEDLGSANGTAVGSPDRKAARSPIRPGDTVYLGTLAIPASDLLARLDPAFSRVAATVALQAIPSRATPGGGLDRPLRLLGLGLQAPILALGICALFGVNLPPPPEGGREAASVLFWLGLAALWFGLSDAVIGDVLGAGRARDGGFDLGGLPGRLGIVSALGVVQCLLAWGIAAWAVGLSGPWAVSIGVLILTLAVGLALGTLILGIAPRAPASWVGLGLAVVPLWLLGGGPQSLPRGLPPIRVVSDFLPTRWAFEGLLHGAARRDPVEPEGEREAPAGLPDPAEPYFPAVIDRMGPRADAMALAAMLVGLSAVAGLVIRASGPARGGGSGP